MTPKEKADELIDKFSEYSHTDFNYSRGGYQFDSQIQNAKQCALIAVNEILKAVEYDPINIEAKEYYWEEVKYEIKNI